MFLRTAPSLLAIAVFIGWAQPSSAEEDPVVGSVNGYEIRLSEVREAQSRLPKQYQQIPFDTIFPGLVESLIDTRLAAADARSQKLHEKQEFKDQMARIEEQLLQRMVLSQAMKAGVSDADLKARYKTFAKEMAASQQIKASHILVENEAAAKEIIAALDKGGDFAALAKEKSTGPSSSKGGDLGYFGKGQMVPAFEAAAFKLKKGEYTKVPVKTQFGWHIIKVDDRKSADAPSFDEAKEGLRNELSEQAGTAYILRLRSSAKIARFNADGSPLKAPGEGAKPAK